jgi:alkanesulfonate monooxygenase SsuD/methylene tetrahydromethanopterin reductase-like flavin-dependent oxidoreductase (luciferase family)
MRFALMTEPQQGLSYEELLAIASTAEESGFEAFFRSDHYTSFPGDAHLRTTDAWTTLGGLARETKRINLGVLVSPVTFRIPGSFAKVVMTADEMSGGRVEVGVGAGWNALEHAEHGIPYPDVRERVDMLEEELQLLTGLWDEPDGWGMTGAHWGVKDAYLRPRDRSVYAPGATRPRPNLIVGGSGRPRNLRLAARFADEYNVSSVAPDVARDVFARLDDAIREADRDPAAVTHSAMVGVLVGRDDAEVERRMAAVVEALGGARENVAGWLAERRGRWLIGTPAAAREALKPFADAGAERVMLQDFIPRDLDHVKAMAEILLG